MAEVAAKRGRAGATARAAASAVVAAVTLAVAAGSGTAGAHGAPADAGATGHELRVSGRFAPPHAFVPSPALTYDQRLVPAAADITVRQRAEAAGTTVAVSVRGLARRHTFGVHVHTRPCGTLPEDAGPHYQHVRDPNPPSTDPAYANPGNEVWLDLRTDRRGGGRSAVRQPWHFRTGEARSVVLHEHATSTEHGEAGMAGARVACFTVPLSGAGRE